MNYSLNELRDNILEKVSGLGISPNFKENPAFSSALVNIENSINQMNITEEVMVQESNGRIDFNYTSPSGEKYSMNITCFSPDTFKCVRTTEKKPYINMDGKTVREKNAVEEIATINNSGTITLTTNGSMINNIDCDYGKCNNITSTEQKNYTQNGIMISKESKSFKMGELTQDFSAATVDSMLYIPREASNNGFYSNKYETRTLLNREYLDTARVIFENKTNGANYNSSVPLNQEHGLRDMTVGNYYSPDVVISPLSKEEIDMMIQRESNPKVIEGLNILAVNRENYSYNSLEDPNFVYEGFEQTQEISK